MRNSTRWKVCLGVLVISVLAWIPQGVTPALTWWSPALCWAGGDASNPETIIVGSVSDNRVTTCSVIKGNELTGRHGTYNTIMSNSFAGFKGISQVNQAAGSMNNQMNAASICGSPGQLSVIGQSSKSQIKDNDLHTFQNSYTCSINGGSFAKGSGIAQVNQSAGNMNSQYNGFAMNIGTAGSKGATCLTDTELCTAQTNNHIKANSNKSSTYLSADSDPSKNSNFHGVFGSSQVSGDLNNVKTLFTVTIIPK